MEYPPDNSWLEPIKRQYYAVVPLKQFIWPDDLDDATQLDFYNEVLNDIRMVNLQPRRSYIFMIFKALQRSIEGYGDTMISEIAEIWQNMLIQSCTRGSEDEGFSYKSYFLDENLKNGVVLTLKESDAFLCKGTTGLVTWEAAKILSDFLIQNEHILKDVHAIELGCGLGLVGMTACLFGKPKQYSFTDRSAVVLSTLAKNLKLNAVNYTAAELPSDTQDEKTSADDSHVTAVRTPVANLRFLDWVEASNDEIAEYDADLFLAADVVFDPVIIEPLVRVISVLLRKSSCYGIISCTIRNPETFELFIKSLDSADVHIETLDHTPSNIYFYDRIAEVRILRLTKSRVH